MTPLVVVEGGEAALDDARGELTALGWTGLVEVTVTDGESAARAVLSALAQRALLVDARAERSLVDQLCDDLRRLGHLDHRIAPDLLLTGEQHALLNLLAEGATLGDAAASMHLSRRSADRRVAEARRILGVESTDGAVAAYRRRLARLPSPP